MTIEDRIRAIEARAGQSIEDLLDEIPSLSARMAALEAASGLFVPDDVLDKKGGNPQVRFSPKRWRGDDYKGCLYSECEPAFLDELAETLCWMADNPQPGKEQYAANNRKDAARARSWGRRIRGGWRPPNFAGGFKAPPAPAAAPAWQPPAFSAPPTHAAFAPPKGPAQPFGPACLDPSGDFDMPEAEEDFT
jgi:hypothetical protein